MAHAAGNQETCECSYLLCNQKEANLRSQFSSRFFILQAQLAEPIPESTGRCEICELKWHEMKKPLPRTYMEKFVSVPRPRKSPVLGFPDTLGHTLLAGNTKQTKRKHRC